MLQPPGYMLSTGTESHDQQAQAGVGGARRGVHFCVCCSVVVWLCPLVDVAQVVACLSPHVVCLPKGQAEGRCILYSSCAIIYHYYQVGDSQTGDVASAVMRE